jgi:hypothetical protein
MLKLTADYDSFRKLLRESDYAQFLTVYDNAYYAKTRVYMYEYAKAGFFIDAEGEIGNLISLGPRGMGKEAMRAAIKLGGTHLMCFDGFLPNYYAKFGFIRSGRQSFNDAYAPDGWDYKKYGRPDVIYMELDRIRKF